MSRRLGWRRGTLPRKESPGGSWVQRSGRPTIDVGSGPFAIASADLNGDGNLDLATANADSEDFSVVLGDGHLGFLPSFRISSGHVPWGMILADMDGNGLDDIVASDGQFLFHHVSIFHNRTLRPFPQGCAGGSGGGLTEGEGGRQVPGDCNQDGVSDIADAVCVLGVLFLGSPADFPCGDGRPDDTGNVALIDWQPDGRVNIADAIASLQFLFLAGPPHALAATGSGNECLRLLGCPDGPSCP